MRRNNHQFSFGNPITGGGSRRPTKLLGINNTLPVTNQEIFEFLDPQNLRYHETENSVYKITQVGGQSGKEVWSVERISKIAPNEVIAHAEFTPFDGRYWLTPHRSISKHRPIVLVYIDADCKFVNFLDFQLKKVFSLELLNGMADNALPRIVYCQDFIAMKKGYDTAGVSHFEELVFVFNQKTRQTVHRQKKDRPKRNYIRLDLKSPSELLEIVTNEMKKFDNDFEVMSFFSNFDLDKGGSKAYLQPYYKPGTGKGDSLDVLEIDCPDFLKALLRQAPGGLDPKDLYKKFRIEVKFSQDFSRDIECQLAVLIRFLETSSIFLGLFSCSGNDLKLVKDHYFNVNQFGVIRHVTWLHQGRVLRITSERTRSTTVKTSHENNFFLTKNFDLVRIADLGSSGIDGYSMGSSLDTETKSKFFAYSVRSKGTVFVKQEYNLKGL